MTQASEKPPTSTAPKKWRILLVDDHPGYRAGLIKFLECEPDLAICAEVSSAAQALTALREKHCNAAIVDIALPGIDGIELTKQLLAERPKLPILIVSMHEESLYGLRALKAGASGYITKGERAGPFLDALRAVLAGEVAVSAAFAKKLIFKVVRGQANGDGTLLDVLSERELGVLQLLGQGKSSREAATALRLSVKTIETHRQHIKEKLGFETAPEMICFAVEWVGQQT